MDLNAIYHYGTLTAFGVALLAFPLLFFITVPYGGRHTSERWGPTLPSTLAWFLMEVPAPICLLLAYDRGQHAGEPISVFLLTLFLAHYAHRAVIYPLRARGTGKRTPLLSASAAFCVNVLNGTIQGLAVSHASSYDTAWLTDPRFLLGIATFVTGATINLRSDAILRNLRAPGQTGYQIPHGGLYRFISSPNYFGEIVQWAGWALATWSTAGLGFCLLTIANLSPRARSNQRWYRETFPEYPENRRILIPGIW